MNFKNAFWALVLAAAFLLAPTSRAEEDVELALDPPDEPIEEAESGAPMPNPGSDLEIFDGTYVDETRPTESTKSENYSGNSQQELLRYHQRIISEREKIRAANEEEPPHTFHFGFGVFAPASSAVGFNADFQLYLSDHFTVGPVFNYINFRTTVGDDSAVAKVSQFMGAVSYYSRRPFEGIWVQAGAGFAANSFVASTSAGNISTSTTTVPIIANLGWSWLGDKNLTFAVAVGTQSFFFEASPQVNLTATVQLGVAWNVFPH